ncbi:hypothetical protein J4409_01475 [Candidatus Woesearchaeota archaeon]|nr:hypothetical protein [Candidatus Woesearchaeota archaeon]
MSIKTDALELLKLIMEKEISNSNELSNVLQFEKTRVTKALKYLEDKSLIRVTVRTMDGSWKGITSTAEGIDLCEEQLTITSNNSKLKNEYEQTLSLDLTDSLSRIEQSINAMLSRQHREKSYYASLYSLLAATFIALGFSSMLEYLKAIVPNEYARLLILFHYILFFVSIGLAARYIQKLRASMDVLDYSATFKIDTSNNILNLMPVAREIFEKNEHQITQSFIAFSPKFEGLGINGLSFLCRSYRVDINRKEQIIMERYQKEVCTVLYTFDYVNANVTSSVALDFNKKTLTITLDKAVESRIAKKIFTAFKQLPNSQTAKISGWDHGN